MAVFRVYGRAAKHGIVPAILEIYLGNGNIEFSMKACQQRLQAPALGFERVGSGKLDMHTKDGDFHFLQ
jgi:hypothetical protein